MFQLVHHVVERPDLRTPFFAQVRGFKKVVAVHVGDDDRVDGLESAVLAQTLQRRIQELLVEQSAI